MKKGYSKNNAKKKIFLKILIAIFILLIIVGILACLFLFQKNVTIENIDEAASFVSDDVATNSTPIIVNNLVLGGKYKNTWVSNERYYKKSKNKTQISVDMYNLDGKAGNYTITSMLKDDGSSAVYVKTSNETNLEEYFAVTKNDKDIIGNLYNVKNVSEYYIKKVNQALGIYRLLNSTVKISSVYEVNINANEKVELVTVTSQNADNGIYSAIIMIDQTEKASIVKYSYAKDVNDCADFPIYLIKFLADLNDDGNNELIVQETKEFEVKYDVLEFRNNKVYEVLSSYIKE